jgi:hypothetical protein
MLETTIHIKQTQININKSWAFLQTTVSIYAKWINYQIFLFYFWLLPTSIDSWSWDPCILLIFLVLFVFVLCLVPNVASFSGLLLQFSRTFIYNSNMRSFFRFVDKRAIYRLGIISLAHAPVVLTWVGGY